MSKSNVATMSRNKPMVSQSEKTGKLVLVHKGVTSAASKEAIRKNAEKHRAALIRLADR